VLPISTAKHLPHRSETTRAPFGTWHCKLHQNSAKIDTSLRSPDHGRSSHAAKASTDRHLCCFLVYSSCFFCDNSHRKSSKPALGYSFHFVISRKSLARHSHQASFRTNLNLYSLHVDHCRLDGFYEAPVQNLSWNDSALKSLSLTATLHAPYAIVDFSGLLRFGVAPAPSNTTSFPKRRRRDLLSLFRMCSE